MSVQMIELEEVCLEITDETLEGMVAVRGEKLLLLFTPHTTVCNSLGC